MKLLHIDSSILGDNSASRQLTAGVVKAWQTAEPAALTRFQTQALLHTAHHARALPIPRIVPTRDGRTILPTPEGALRLLTWLPGMPLAHLPRTPALAGLGYFGVVQYIGRGRSADWITYFERMFDFHLLPDAQRFGILPKGKLMRSPCKRFLWQLIEPDPGLEWDDMPERLQRIGLGTTDVPAAVQALRQRGVEFVESSRLHPDDRGALTRNAMGTVVFELVHRDA